MRFRVGRSGMAVALLILLAVVFAACGQIRGDDDGTGGVVIGVRTPISTPVPTLAPPTAAPTLALPTVAPTPALAPLESPEATSTVICTFNDFRAPPELLQVLEPQPEAEVSAPLLVRGWGSNIGIDEKGVAVGLVTADGTLVTVLEVPPLDREEMEPPEGLDDTEFSRPFVAEVPVEGLSEPTSFCLWVYLDTTEDGLPVDAVQMPVVVVP